MADLLPDNNPLTARLRNVARTQGVTVEQLASRSDRSLLWTTNLGSKSVHLLRQYYPSAQRAVCPHCGQELFDRDSVEARTSAERRWLGMIRSDAT